MVSLLMLEIKGRKLMKKQHLVEGQSVYNTHAQEINVSQCPV
jgi:hypothetical protein